MKNKKVLVVSLCIELSVLIAKENSMQNNNEIKSNKEYIESIEMLKNSIKPGDIYEHYKGKRYRIIGISCHSEDLTWYVVYEALYDNPVSKVWHRPLEMFLGTLEVDGKEVQRFVRVEQ